MVSGMVLCWLVLETPRLEDHFWFCGRGEIQRDSRGIYVSRPAHLVWVNGLDFDSKSASHGSSSSPRLQYSIRNSSSGGTVPIIMAYSVDPYPPLSIRCTLLTRLLRGVFGLAEREFHRSSTANGFAARYGSRALEQDILQGS